MNNKDLIKQYVNTGLRIPEYQINRLSSNDLKSYLRVRTISGLLTSFEYDKLDESGKDNYVNGISSNDLEDNIIHLCYRNLTDDFVYRIVNLRSPSDIKQNLFTIINNTNSQKKMINTLVNKFGQHFRTGDIIYQLLNYFDTDEEKLMLGIKLMNKHLEHIDGGFTSENSPMFNLLYYLKLQPEFIRYVFETNVIRNGGKKFKLVNNTFLTFFDKTKDENKKFLFDVMEKYVDLEPSQQDYIDTFKRFYV